MSNTLQHTSYRLLIAFLLSIVTMNTANAEVAADEVRFENIESYVLNDMLYLSFDLKLQGDFLSSGDALHICPVYRTGEYEINLPSILVNGKQRARYYRREQSLLTKSERMANKPFAVVVRNNKEQQEVSYNYVLALPEGARTKGTLQIKQLLQDCCDLALIDSKLLPTDYRYIPDPAIFANSVTYITPKAEKMKKRNDHIVVRIDYPVNEHLVLPNFADNKATLEKMDKEVEELFTNTETYKIDNANIKGFASPEDTYEHNLNLSRRRTDTFKNYLVNKYGLKDLYDFPASGMGEDWEGLRKAVEASNMEHKAAVLRIIDTEGVFDGREKQLMDLAGGKPYNYMLQELFPPLRRMEMRINYTVRPFHSDEVETVMQDRPKGLSQLEMFDYVLRRNNKELFYVAAEYFPNSVSANVNASSVALTKGDVDTAWSYLQKIENNPEAYNNLGVYYWLCGDMVRAESYFQKALSVEGQRENADANIKMLEKYLIR